MVAIPKLLVIAATTVALGGWYSSQCEKMGYGPEGSPANERCVYVLSQQAAQHFARAIEKAGNDFGAAYDTPYGNRYAYTINTY